MDRETHACLRVGIFDQDENLVDSTIALVEITNRLYEADIDFSKVRLEVWEAHRQ